MDTTPAALWRPGHMAVVGLGLLGASLIEAARRNWPGIQVTGISSAATLEKALEVGLIDRGFSYSDIDLACAEVDLVILCTPIDHIQKLLTNWIQKPPTLKSGCIVTDVGSTKFGICNLGRLAFQNGQVVAQGQVRAHFIGSHPMAGSEKTGLEARDALLFQNASWVLCPPDNSEDQEARLALSQLESFAQALGARTTQMTPELHDTVAAHVSHLPQLLATALASFIGTRRNVVENCLQIAGGGFRDMTRLAASAFSVWEPILQSNRDAVRVVFDDFIQHLTTLSNALETNLGAPFFENGNQLRGQISKARKGFALPLSEILVNLEDRPGTLLKVFSPLAAKGLNVLDVEILKVREGEDGTMMLGFHGNEEALAALDCLQQSGFKARLR